MTIHLTLPGAYYTDPAIFRREMDRFFFEKWICVGREEEVDAPGKYFVRDVAGESIIVTRDNAGELSAMYNVCRHRGTRMCEESAGKFPGRIQCPYHAWTYALNGDCIGANGMQDNPEFKKSEHGLQRVHVDTWDGHVFVNLAASPPSLASQLGVLPEKFARWGMADLRLAKRTRYSLNANWKLIIQNYSECLHCPSIHPALLKVSPHDSGDNEPANEGYLGGRMELKDGCYTMSLTGKQMRDPLPGLPAEERRYVYYYAVLPNLLLSLHPDFMMTHTLWPRAADRTEVLCELHFHKDAMQKPDFTFADAQEFWDITNKQDWKVSELSQLGISSRAYRPGPYTNREQLLWSLDDLVRERRDDA